MENVHDRGGWPTEEPIDKSEHQIMDWEQRVQALVWLLSRKGMRRVDEARRSIESIEPELYESISYYDRWVVSLETLLVERNILTGEEIDRKATELEQRWRQ